MRLTTEKLKPLDSYTYLLSKNAYRMQELDDILKDTFPEYAQHFHDKVFIHFGSFMSRFWTDETQRKEAMDKVIELAKITAKGIDISTIKRSDDIPSEEQIKNFPKLTPISYYERIGRMESIMKEQCGIEPTKYTFANSQNQDEVPLQGWKLHISATDLDDYERLLSYVARDLSNMGAVYKVVSPDQFERLQNSSQAGKAITVYLTPAFDINKFSQESQIILDEQSVAPNGDCHFAGRIYARYGRCMGGELIQNIVNLNGQLMPDNRGEEIAPDFVTNYTPQSILTFYQDCERRFQEHGDLKRYLIEKALMVDISSDPVTPVRQFTIMECSKATAELLKYDLAYRNYGLSVDMEYNGKTYLIADMASGMELHNSIEKTENGKNIYTTLLRNIDIKESSLDGVQYSLDESGRFSFEVGEMLGSIYNPVPMIYLIEISEDEVQKIIRPIEHGHITLHKVDDVLYMRDDETLAREYGVKEIGYITVPAKDFDINYPTIDHNGFIHGPEIT